MTDTLPIRRMAQITLGKMVQPEAKSVSDIEAPYVRAAHVQPDGRLIELPEQPMWFSKAELRALELRCGDIVVVEGGAGYGRSATLAEDLPSWGFQNSIIRLRAREGLAHGKFIDYALQSALCRGKIGLVANTATIPHFTAEKVGRFEIPAPPFAEQWRISEYLDNETAQVDALIAKQRELISRLRERRIAEITSAVTLGIRPGAPLVESGIDWIRRVPSHWRVGRLKHSIASAQTGVWGDEERGDGNDVLCVRVADFDRPALRVQREVPTRRSVQRSDRDLRLLAPGDLLIEKSGGTPMNPVGFVAYFDGADEPAVASNFISRLRVHRGHNSKYWLYAHAASYATRLTARSVKQTTGIQNLDLANYFNERFPYPPPDEQDEIVRHLEGRTAKIDALIGKAVEFIALARERRAALITEAVTGRIEVSTGKAREGV